MRGYLWKRSRSLRSHVVSRGFRRRLVWSRNLGRRRLGWSRNLGRRSLGWSRSLGRRDLATWRSHVAARSLLERNLVADVG